MPAGAEVLLQQAGCPGPHVAPWASVVPGPAERASHYLPLHCLVPPIQLGIRGLTGLSCWQALPSQACNVCWGLLPPGWRLRRLLQMGCLQEQHLHSIQCRPGDACLWQPAPDLW